MGDYYEKVLGFYQIKLGGLHLMVLV